MSLTGILGTVVILGALFVAKILDNMLGTAKNIFIQQNRTLLSCLTLTASTFISFWATQIIVLADGYAAMAIASLASGVGCALAMIINNHFSKDRMYVNILMSDNREGMQKFRDYLADHHITNVASDSYVHGRWDETSLTVTAYTETKAQNSLIDRFCEENKTDFKFKRKILKS